MFNSKKFFKCLTLTFLFVISSINIFASKSLEKKIKKLEAEVIEYEKKHLNKQNQKGYTNKNAVAKITGLSDKEKKNKVIQKSKEINVELPEYDPETKMVSIRSNYIVRIDAKTIGSAYSKKVYLNVNNNAKDSNFENYIGSEEITVENGNLVLVDKNSNQKQIISDIESKLSVALNEELASEKSKLSKNNSTKSNIGKNSKKETNVGKSDIVNNKKKPVKKEVHVIVEGFDIINRVDAPI